jgi:hypothetical protein
MDRLAAKVACVDDPHQPKEITMSTYASVSMLACLTAVAAWAAPLQAQTPPAPAASSLTADPQQNVTNKSREPHTTGPQGRGPSNASGAPAPGASRPSTKTSEPAPESQRRPDPVPAGAVPQRPSLPTPTAPGASRPSSKTNEPAPELRRRPDPVPAGASAASAPR